MQISLLLVKKFTWLSLVDNDDGFKSRIEILKITGPRSNYWLLGLSRFGPNRKVLELQHLLKFQALSRHDEKSLMTVSLGISFESSYIRKFV